MATAKTKAELFREVEQTFGHVPEWMTEMPDGFVDGFWTLMRDVELAETAIPNKYKELIGLAVSGATRCRYCALFHTEAARVHGATDAEIREASAMGGLTMLASTYLNATQTDYARFKKDTTDIVAYVKKQQKAQPAPRASTHAAAKH